MKFNVEGYVMNLKNRKEVKVRYPLFPSMHDIVNYVAETYGDNILYKYWWKNSTKYITIVDSKKLYLII